LVRRAKQGEVGAFEGLYRANVGRVFAVCLRLCGQPALAEELTQEAFVRAWQKLHTFRGESAFSTWLHRLAVNVALGHLRRRGHQDQAAEQLPSAHAEPAAGTMTRETGIDLERAISGLPKRARTVFVLHDVEGYRHDEIAKLAGMAVGTSKAHLFRARRLLREALA
jgi:RNA polymerase sigma-70 factor (ECF subfamily)